ncbi:MAG TPA: GNAT family N-acetyltransferase [Candidatus Methylacidiphilales bacterium]|jgi:phosphinothricin acetyltransferase|nr:GNAT family N-acetyltransferase [Candidatus Methylacidiphilales bacterium]
MKMPLAVVPCTERHLPAIRDILNDAILHTTALYEDEPRTPEQVAAWFAHKQKENLPLLGIESAAGTLAGFATYGPFRPHYGYRFAVEHSVYVAEAHRGQGIGHALLRALIDTARARQLHVMIGVIDAANAASIRFHRAHGFEPCGTLRQAGYKFNRWLDVEFLQLILR